MTLLVGMVADDLTGALDAAAPFAGQGLETVVLISPDSDGALPPDAEVLCINTASRELTDGDAVDRVIVATRRLAAAGPRRWFKKIDSRLKGHLAQETSAMLAVTGLSRALVAPAIPDLGRVVADGAVQGMGVARPIAIAPAFAGLEVAVPECHDDAALDALAAGAEADAATLVVGARGMAQAMARRLPSRRMPELAELPRPLLVAIGSRDPITRAQVEVLKTDFAVQHLAAPNGAVPEAECGGEIMLVTAEAGAAAESGVVVARRFADGVARLVRQLRPATLLICGGETAFALLRELGVASLRLRGEVLPGVPVAIGEIEGEQVVILTKSGGFGAPEAISLLVAHGETVQ